MNRSTIALTLISVLITASTATAATSAQQCEAAKNRIAGTYYGCRAKAESSAILKEESPDYSRCAGKFDVQWGAAEERGQGSCPDNALRAEMEAFVAGQASVTAGILAGTEVPSCGDGSINVHGEHCDGADLGGTTCADLSYVGGILACDATCRFDATGCDCPAGSKRVNGFCWLLAAGSPGPPITNCDQACATLGLTCNETALQSIGSSGTAEACRAMADIVNPSSGPHSGSTPFDATSCGASDLAGGCMTYPDVYGDVAVQALHSGSPTRCDADMDPIGCFFYPSLFRRVCACNP